MTIEAVQQVIPENRAVQGYLVKQVEFISPILVPDSWERRTETQIRLRPVKGSQNEATSLFDIVIFSYSRERWTECCNAIVMVEYGDRSLNMATDEVVRDMYESASASCSRPLDSRVLYRDAAEHGLQYGEMFQLLQGVCWDGRNNALARVDVTKAKFRTESLVHPAVLDQAFQVLRVSAGQQRAANIPVRLVDAWFAPSGWQHPQNGSIHWLATSHTTSRGEYGNLNGEKGSIHAIAEDGTVLCRIQQAIMATVSKETDEKDRKLLHSIEWKPQLSLLDPGQLSRLYTADIKADEPAMVINYQKLCSILNAVAVHTLRDLDRSHVPGNLRRHLEWLNFHVQKLPPSQWKEAVTMSKAEIETRLAEIDNILPSWKLYTECARRLPEILIGQRDPLEVIFKSDLADIFYAGLFDNLCADGRLASVLDLAAHENPAMRVLEVGAGTGGMTAQVMAALEGRESRTGAPSFAEYNYTDISPMFLGRAKARWPRLQAEGRLNFQTLDINQAIENQGFQPGYYDLVIAGSVLHATPDLEATIRNVRNALKPGGRLILLEAIKPADVVTNFMAGLTPGWWIAREKWRPHSPAVSEVVWDHRLRKNGFSGNDMVIRDYQSEDCHVVSIIVSTAMEEAPKPGVGRLNGRSLVLVVNQNQLDKQLPLANSVRNSLDPQGDLQTNICSLSADDLQKTLANASDSIVVCLVEVNQPLLARLSEEGFTALRALTQNAPRLLWVTSPCPSSADSPEYSIMQGFLRSIRAEQPSSHIVSLNIEGETDTTACANSIAKIVETSFGPSASQELEYISRDGVFLTARAIENVVGNKAMQRLLLPQLEHTPWAATDAVQLSMGDKSTTNSPIFVRDTVHDTPLGHHEIEIQADFWGLTQRDINSTVDRTKDDMFGGDCAGVVTRVGRDCDQSIQVGDRVCMLVGGCMRKYPRSHETGVVKIPENVTLEAVASNLYPATLAYRALIDVSRLEEGDTVLIHLAASSVGQAAVHLAQKLKARIFATTASSEEKQFLVQVLGIPSADIFTGKDEAFRAGIIRATGGDGVDVVLNSLVGEDLLRASCNCLALGGRLIEISDANIKTNINLPLDVLTRNVTFTVIGPTRLRQVVLSRLLKTVITMIGGGEVQIPRPPPVYSVSQLERAFSEHQEEAISRVVVSAGPQDVIPVSGLANKSSVSGRFAYKVLLQQIVKEQPAWKFDESASYLIAGGFGGIGRAILQWMAERGAKHLIVPSRSGALSKAAAETVAQLTAQGVTVVAPQCDVSSETSLSRVLDECVHTMPPIKGCINAAMVLQDGIFQENMTFGKWDLAVWTKVQTSWNLHRLLPDNLDFFILLSSLAGVIGQMASSNYAGGCSFQDALARYRIVQGQRAVSIDIGWMRNIGIISETGAYQRQRQAADDMRPIDGADLLALLTIYCNPDVPQSTSQVLLGLGTPADHLAKGQTPPALLDRPLLAAFSYLPGSGASHDQDTLKRTVTDPATLFRKSADSSERIDIVLRALAVKLAGAMSISPEDVDPSKALSIYGVDSLMAVDLRNWIGTQFGATVAVFDIMGGVSIASIADLVVAKSTVKSK